MGLTIKVLHERQWSSTVESSKVSPIVASFSVPIIFAVQVFISSTKVLNKNFKYLLTVVFNKISQMKLIDTFVFIYTNCTQHVPFTYTHIRIIRMLKVTLTAPQFKLHLLLSVVITI